MRDSPWGPFVALVVVQLSFATLPIAGKHALDAGVPPLVLSAIRVFFAALILAGLALVTRRERVQPRHLLQLAGLSLLGVAVNIALFIEGLQRSTPINAGVLIATIPVFTLLVAVVMRRERLQGARLLGIVLALAGTLIVLRVDAFDLADRYLLGNLLIVLNCLSYSFYLVLVKDLLQTYRSSTVVAWVFLFGSLALTPLGASSYAASGSGDLGKADVALAMAWIILVPSVLSYSLNNYALKRVRPSTVAGFVPLQPIATALLALWLRPDDPLDWRTLAAAVPILLGVAIVGRTERIGGVAETGKPISLHQSSPARGGPQPEPQEDHP